jgi:DNA-binding NarL/FixJ family response regulator
MARTKPKRVTLYVVEEQEIYREVYKSVLSHDVLRAPFDLLKISGNDGVAAVRQAIADLRPDVLLVGTKRLEADLIEELEQVRVDNPKVAIVLLLVFYDTEGIQSLRRIASKGDGGMALFLKQSLDRIEQLSGIIVAASQGQVILDPALATFLFTEKMAYPFLTQLTTRESEILSLLAKGYTNAAIANTLYIDVKTVEHHINSMYGKLKAEADFDRRHPRVSAARLYLEATGELMPRVVPAGKSDPAPSH